MEPNFEFNYGKNSGIGKYANIGNFSMYYEIYGKGEPLLVIHGNGSSIAGMGFQIEYFKDSFQVIAADSRGHGNSEMNSESLSYEQMAKDWLELIRFLGLKKVNILGWSDGGIIGILMAIQQPQIVNKLVSMGANVKPHREAMVKLETQLLENAMRDAELKSLNGERMEYWLRKSKQLKLLWDQPDVDWQDLKRIICSTLILAGEKDSVKRAHTLQIAECIAGSECHIFKGEDHFMPVSNPINFNLRVKEFLMS